MKYRFLLLFFSYLVSLPVLAQQKKDKVIYEYKKKEFFDFGEISIRGNILTPGDLSVKLKDRKKFDTSLPVRKDFDREVREDLKHAQ